MLDFSEKILAMGAQSEGGGFPKVSDNLKSIEPEATVDVHPQAR